MSSLSDGAPMGENNSFSFISYHFLHDQYRAFVLGPGLSQLCLARNDFLRAGLDFLIRILGSPKFTFFTFLVFGSLTYTLNFLTSPCMGLPSLTLRPLYSASSTISSCQGKKP